MLEAHKGLEVISEAAAATSLLVAASVVSQVVLNKEKKLDMLPVETGLSQGPNPPNQHELDLYPVSLLTFPSYFVLEGWKELR